MSLAHDGCLLLALAQCLTPVLSDGRVQNRIENYNAFWKDDPAKEEEQDNKSRLEQYTDVVNGYYDGATDLYEYGWAQSFHFSRFYKGEAFLASLARHEHYLASQMTLRPGMRVLDVGCGVGGPAREIAMFSDVNIVGLNNNDFQIQKGRRYTKRMGLENQLSEQFGENSFDAVYAIEATVHAPSFEGVYGEIFKILKPGGVFGVYEWVMTEDWDPSIPRHKELAHQIELGNGIPEMRHISSARNALKNVGFDIEHEEDLADRSDEIPWYYPLEGDMRKAQTFWDYLTVWRTSKMGQFFTHNGTWLMEKVGLIPKGTWSVGESLRLAGDALVAGGQSKLFTPMYLVVSRKPKMN
ncbi:delta-sterol C-methyltransferase [Coprinellus micaceus]|uniref:Delta-sterol C-methyltransferase n=1 Tax=Coprinellus micaceus TaxID=71717 RepID=A0A4Y7TRG3_COPMI|nr:delta-sterol C-methyltransferase [Coprinellus micaceus]